MRILVFEYVSGGGYADQKLSSSILSEAYGMYRTIVSDFKTAGHNVTTLMDSRLVEANAPTQADKIVSVDARHQIEKKIEELSGVVDEVYVIAPESGQVLQKLLQTTEELSISSLNCESDAVKLVSNKITVHETLKKNGVKVPDTVLLDVKETTQNLRNAVKELEYPLVFKPLDGTSCEGLSKVTKESEIQKAVKKITETSTSGQFLAQKHVKGNSASACVISTGKKAVAVSLNKQLVTLVSPDEESVYFGGIIPFRHRLEEEALRAAEKAVEAVKGLKGYVGVDLLLTDEEPVVIEINPRLTVSYIGLQKVANFNTADAITAAVTKQKLPTNTQTTGYSYFSKIKLPSRAQDVPNTYRLKNVVSPPFVTGEKEVYAFVAASSSMIKGAKSAFYRTKKRLFQAYGGC